MPRILFQWIAAIAHMAAGVVVNASPGQLLAENQLTHSKA